MRFDMVLRIFAVILLLPLVCLPIVYLWIMRRMNTAEALARLERDFGSDRHDDLLAGGVKVKEIMDGFREVGLVQSSSSAGDGDASNANDPSSNNDHEKEMIRVVGIGKESWSGDRLRERDTVKDCCICMSDFETVKSIRDKIQTDEHASGHEASSLPFLSSSGDTTGDIIIETKCGHLFHKACIGGWIGGNNWEDVVADNGGARRRCCPLCREDLAIDATDAV